MRVKMFRNKKPGGWGILSEGILLFKNGRVGRDIASNKKLGERKKSSYIKKKFCTSLRILQPIAIGV